ncbi:DUF4382 domain-containing protein [Corallococcus exiguus]|uniref:DUF4382 domain-containing protein n=1 Tax=Corallococcus TaxID=83461 RepID=UPI000EBCAEE8|nr:MULTISPECIES: DUF4382 domain-containing protein [Corallococcus]NNB83953.1 DUF4382 domain-containing protein [Corallococcus exiguus]NNB92309.1 DUF4382 domain-containing protein [Corallococcus exiguus]NNC01454.1 DUF4382 domain-containing protein [Corallococcus exiguus]NNC14131.1 DUF4382 domain-containing protein [Corallococcus exiguus]NPC46087.1 DUF4382 domain-containing protein [Corallococcus exiguus]
MRRFIGLFASLMWLSACGNSTSSVGLSTRMGSAVTGSALTRTSSQRLELSNGITVERVRLSVRELELKREGHHDDRSDDDSDAGSDDDKSEFKQRTGPFLIDLSGTALDGQMVRLQDISVDVGTYDEIEFDIGKVDPATAPTALKELAEQGASLIIDGHIDGEPFQFVSSLRVEQEREVSFEIAEGDDQNVTFNIDPSGWFTDKDGKRLDPRESSARSQLENNLQKSIDAFDDHDRNGGEDDDDHDRHGGRSGGED